MIRVRSPRSTGTECRRRTCFPAPLSDCARSVFLLRHYELTEHFLPDHRYNAGPEDPGARDPGAEAGYFQIEQLPVCGEYS